MIGEQG
jgi:hypothetical protein